MPDDGSLATGASVVRRTILLWGLGHLALGDRRRAVTFAAFEIVAAVSLGWAGPPLAQGSLAAGVLLAGVAFLAGWAAIALDAYRRAVAMRRAAGLPGQDGGAVQLLALVPLAIGGTALLWATGGGLARPETTLARYVADWRGSVLMDGAAEREAAGLFSGRRPSGLADAWDRQTARLTNELVRAAGAARTDGGIDPSRPFESVRFLMTDTSSSADAGAGDTVTVGVQLVRRDAVRGTLAGLVPTSSQILVPIAELGTITLRRVERSSQRMGVPASGVWLIDRVDLLGESLP